MLLHCCCVQPLSPTYPAPLTAVSMIARAVRSRLELLKVAAEQLPEDSPRALLATLNAALLVLELLGHVAVGPAGHADAVSRAAGQFVAREVGGVCEL